MMLTEPRSEGRTCLNCQSWQEGKCTNKDAPHHGSGEIAADWCGYYAEVAPAARVATGKAATALANLCAAETGDVVHGRSTTTIARSAVRGAYIVCCRIAPEEFDQIALVWNRWTTMARALSDDEIARTTCTSCRKEGC